MSPSIKAVTNMSDRALAETAKATGKPVMTGKVNEEYRVKGKALLPDTCEVKLFITLSTGAGVGDKLVLANQLKSTIGEVMTYDMTTESGDKIDIVFGSKSVAARVVHSPFIIGTTATVLKLVAKKAVAAYNK